MYTIGDFLIRIKNGYLAHKRSVELPYSKVAHSLSTIMKEEKYIKGLEVVEIEGKKALKLDLSYQNGRPAMQDVKIISKPSVQVYISKNKLARKMRGDIGTNIVSTSKGMMTDENASKQGLGGELICQIM